MHAVRLLVSLVLVVAVIGSLWPPMAFAGVDSPKDTLEWQIEGATSRGAITLTVSASSTPSHPMITSGNTANEARTTIDETFRAHTTFSSEKGEVPTRLTSRIPSLRLVMTVNWKPEVCSSFKTGLSLTDNFTNAGWISSRDPLYSTVDNYQTQQGTSRDGEGTYRAPGIAGLSRGVVAIHTTPFFNDPECVSFSWQRETAQRPIATGAVLTVGGLSYPAFYIEGRGFLQDDVPINRYQVSWLTEQGTDERVVSTLDESVRYWGCTNWCLRELLIDADLIPRGRGKIKIVVGDQVTTFFITRF